MKPKNENQRPGNAKPSNSQQKIKRPGTGEEDTSSPYVDLDKANFTDRKHGRTNESLGPDHEPSTV